MRLAARACRVAPAWRTVTDRTHIDPEFRVESVSTTWYTCDERGVFRVHTEHDELWVFDTGEIVEETRTDEDERPVFIYPAVVEVGTTWDRDWAITSTTGSGDTRTIEGATTLEVMALEDPLNYCGTKETLLRGGFMLSEVGCRRQKGQLPMHKQGGRI